MAVRVQTARVLTPPRESLFGRFGEGSVLVPPARVTSPECIFIGDGVVILEHAWLSVVRALPGVTPRLEIGDRVRLGRFTSIACVGSVVIHEDVLFSDGVFIGDTYHRYDELGKPVSEQPMSEPRQVEIGSGSFIGIRAIVLSGVSIGRHAYVGAGAVVTKDIPDYAVAVGNPARVISIREP